MTADEKSYDPFPDAGRSSCQRIELDLHDFARFALVARAEEGIARRRIDHGRGQRKMTDCNSMLPTYP